MIVVGDCIEAMAAMDAESVDAIVCDPPYGLGFMGKAWDGPASFVERKAEKRNTFDHVGGNHNPSNAADAARTRRRESVVFGEWCEAWTVEALRVLRPGGHLLAFGGTRTYHRLTCAIEDAGFEVRDCLAWLYGSGFPKSHNLKGDREGWGTALKPAHEPIVMARKPLVGTVAANVLTHGTGAVNVNGCRIGTEGGTMASTPEPESQSVSAYGHGLNGNKRAVPLDAGRWPANVLLDEGAAGMLDAQTGTLHSQDPATRNGGRKPGWSPSGTERPMLDKANPNGGDAGGASRFFYVAKASSAERNAGLDGFEAAQVRRLAGGEYATNSGSTASSKAGAAARNIHPTVKPIALMRWLVRLVTPPGGLVLDPFTGSGTTGCACALESFDFIGIERDPEYARIAEARIAHWTPTQLPLAA